MMRLLIDAVAAACCRAMRRRHDMHDFLQAVGECRWLVVRNRYSVVTEFRELKPNTDLRTTMANERERWIAEGWSATEIGRGRGFFFCDHGEERLCVAIECYEPGVRIGCHWPRFRR